MSPPLQHADSHSVRDSSHLVALLLPKSGAQLFIIESSIDADPSWRDRIKVPPHAGN